MNLKHYEQPRMGRVKHIHFVGIGGAGMCGIAEVLHNEGYRISGSDIGESKAIEHLRGMGIDVFIGHRRENIQAADVVVKSTAVNEDNPEIIEARAKSIPIIPRAAMLAELMRYRQGIAIAGTHGKTTTTSLVSSVLAQAGLDPSYVIGGKLNSSGSNAQLGASPYIVVEADESDASFLYLKPMMAVVTNIDADHMSTYNNDFDKLRQTFVEFLHHLPFYGMAILCIDDEEVRTILPRLERPFVTYGFHQDAQYRAMDWKQVGLQSSFVVSRPKGRPNLRIQLSWPGRHNVQNALATIAIASELDVSDEAIVVGLAQFQGVGRRFQIIGERRFEQGNAVIVDDYGHHPREIATTLDACRRAWPDKKLIHVFQPHRFSRTRELFSDFVDALSSADELILLDIYSAGEEPIPGIDSDTLKQALEHRAVRVQYVKDNDLALSLDKAVSDNSVVLMQGAGSVSQMAHQLIRTMQVS